MAENAQPVVVSANAGFLDSLQAAGRSAVVIVTFITAFLALLQRRDIGGIVNLVQSNGGQVLGAISLIIGFVTYAYGVYKSHKRGSQIASVAADPEVPDEVAQLK